MTTPARMEDVPCAVPCHHLGFVVEKVYISVVTWSIVPKMIPLKSLQKIRSWMWVWVWLDLGMGKEDNQPEDRGTWKMMIIWIPEQTNQCCMHREWEVLKVLEDPKGPVLALCRNALWPAPPRWPGCTRCVWTTAAECAARSNTMRIIFYNP